MIQLSEMERDALAETFNIALGAAVTALAEIANDEVLMTVPLVEFLRTDELVKRLNAPGPGQGPDGAGKLCCITQHFNGPEVRFGADAMLLFPELGSLEIVRCMLGEDATASASVSELEQDALGEVGNIIINSCMTNLASIFGTELVGSLPLVRSGAAGELLPRNQADQGILVVKIGMTLLKQQLNGVVLFIMDVPSLTLTISRIRSFFGIDAESTA